MNHIVDFANAALPWIVMGILLTVFFIRSSKRKSDKEKNDYGSEGITLGMCFGVALGTALHINVGIGMMAGMVFGLLIGSRIEKDGEEKSE
ncbi:hypothetical protein [[Clostridium] polysaccharolyticum]|uniref:Uncharacterized protein n=1 Tax=[Clostridium] polysaccharolyticum TaxID=29364 RepID=A0A1I0BIQ9_9FIRM|nr:hypothetical protein [[Clostridium] polysaccharolyticum]SET06121.1 hypothetical protein SAMN04487772_107126 [[Clostridium] polysaccharolyticum]